MCNNMMKIQLLYQECDDWTNRITRWNNQTIFKLYMQECIDQLWNSDRFAKPYQSMIIRFRDIPQHLNDSLTVKACIKAALTNATAVESDLKTSPSQSKQHGQASKAFHTWQEDARCGISFQKCLIFHAGVLYERRLVKDRWRRNPNSCCSCWWGLWTSGDGSMGTFTSPRDQYELKNREFEVVRGSEPFLGMLVLSQRRKKSRYLKKVRSNFWKPT